MNYNTYLFDFDGVLVDSMPSFISVVSGILSENNMNCDKDIIKTITPLGFAGMIKYFKELGVPMPEEEIGARMKEYIFKEYLFNIPAKKNVVTVLEQLKKSGAELSILTGSPHATLDPCLERIGIKHLFKNTWSSDDFGKKKNNPDIYTEVIQKIGKSAEDILFLDDNFNALKAAKEAGLKICGVFDNSSEGYESEIKALADYYIYNFSELTEVVK